MPSGTGGRPWSFAFIRDVLLGAIYADYTDCDRRSFLGLKVLHLTLQIVYDPIDLSDHCFLNDFDLDAYFDCCDWSALDRITLLSDGHDVRNDLAKAAVSTARD